MKINDLNDDCLKLVFSRLSLREKVKCERVCKLWKELMAQVFMEQKSLEIKVCIEVFETTKLFGAFSKIIEKCVNLKSIDLSDVQIDEQMIRLVMEKCEKLLKLVCVSSMTLSDSLITVFTTGKYANKLTELCISNQSITDSTLRSILETCISLKVLDVSKNDKITGEPSFQCFRSQIKSLNIENCRYIREEGIRLLVSGNGKNLNELKIGTYISEDMIKYITNDMKDLSYFSINARYYPQTFKAQYLSPIARLVNLEHLSLKNLPLLQNCFDETFIKILRGVSKLKSLELNVAQISDKSFEALPKYCPLLESIDYQYSSYPTVINNELTNMGAINLIKLNKLQKLSITGTQIGDSMADVIHLNENLIYLNLFYCVNVSKVTVNACIDLVKSHLKTKFMIIFKGCHKIDRNIMCALPPNIIIE